MERVRSLISKLKEQSEQGASASQMLVTLQLLQTELSQLQVSGLSRLGTSKVAVVLPQPVNVNFDEPVEDLIAKAIKEKAPEEKKPVEEARLVERNELHQARNGSHNVKKQELHKNTYDPMVEIPTLSQQQSFREINESGNSYSESLNDRLKQGSQEVADVLKHEPIKDLRKAIGINDRFVFINDLFRGDEAMYERSIKTINSFSIFPEAEYWINRELIVKIGWDVENAIVKHFYQLVKRRFT